MFDNVNNSGGLTLDPATGVVTGFSDIKSGLSTGAGRLFVYGVVDQKVVASGKLSNGGGANVGGYFSFDPKATQVQLRIATSLIGTAQAKKNLELELPAGSKFEQGQGRGAGTRGTTKLQHDRGRGRDGRPADHALLEPLPAVPLPEQRLREHRYRRRTR